MYLIFGLPKSVNKSFIMVVVDRISKYSHLYALQHSFTATTMAQLFMDNILKHHGMPHSIVYDHDPTFTNNLWKELFNLQETKLHLSASYHAETDDQNEAINKGLETYLRCFSSERKK
jgi:hypothetical protein